jgi:hypothetical protein
VSDTGDDKNDGRSDATPIRSWARVLELKTGNDKIHIIGASSEATKLRLIADAKKRYKKKRLSAEAKKRYKKKK